MDLAPNTVRAYRADWAHFEGWCRARRRRALPASATTVAVYVAELAQTRKASTVRRRVFAIAGAHRAASLEPPTRDVGVRVAALRIERDQRARFRPTAPLTVDDLEAMSVALPEGAAGARDRALLLLGFGGGLRRSELVALDVRDVEATRRGLRMRVGGRPVVLPFGSRPSLCAVTAWRTWTRVGDLERGPLFRAVDRHGHMGARRLSDRAVALVVKRAAARAGLDPARYSGDSLRRGLVLAAAERGAPERGIMAQTGHRTRRLVRDYMRDGTTPRNRARL
jgi:site-specific recombinase XerD